MHSSCSCGINSLHEPRFAFWGMIPYQDAMRRMAEAQEKRIVAAIRDTVFYQEHEPVVTHGRSTPAEHLQRKPHAIPTYGVPRGGQATYHGPGQLVGYAVLNLAARQGGRGPDLHDYLRCLERGIIAHLDRHYGLLSSQRDGYTGVWIADNGGWRKLASIGVSVRRWVTAHGFALNIAPDLEPFRLIIPCGNAEDSVTSVAAELEKSGRVYIPEPMKSVAESLHGSLTAALHDDGWCTGTV